ncbi:MAG: hypothetical protein Q7T76_19115 [Ferruginibacter sp.]|nr:hypothetical protein [Ferruginibacter sp.]
MPTERIHPLVEILAGQINKEQETNPETLRSLDETFRLIGFDKVSNIDLGNISDFVDITGLTQGAQPAVAEVAQGTEEDEQFHIFARTTPIRSSQLEGGINPFIRGTAVSSVGPFVVNDRPPFWIDFIRTQRSLAVFIQGNPQPVLYCKVAVRMLTGMVIPLPSQPLYTIVAGSVWVQAKFLHAAAPVDLYAGLKVASGTLEVSGPFTTSQTGIVLGPGAAFSCKLQLVQKAIPENLPAGRYGQDARSLTINLPTEFEFSSQGISKVGAADATVFGNSISAAENTSAVTRFFSHQNRLGISLNLQQEPVFSINETQSPLVDINGQTTIEKCWWALPLAQVQLMLPLEAEGNGALLVECGDGLLANIKRSTPGGIYLKKPQFLLEPGRINLTDQASNGFGKIHQFSLWLTDEKFPIETSIRFLKAAPFVFNTLAQGEELLNSTVGFNIEADRPVNIRNEAVPLRSDRGTMTLAANEIRTTIQLKDYELMLDKNAGPNDMVPAAKKMSLALTNALLTTTYPASVNLQAIVGENFVDLAEGFLEVNFGLFAYLPTLPDPYVANLGLIRRQFLRNQDTAMLASNPIVGSEVWMWVLAGVRWSNADKLVETSFELADYNRSKIVTNYRLPFPAPNLAEIETKRTLFIPLRQENNKPDAADFKQRFINHSNDAEPGSERYREDVNPVFSDFALLDVSSNANQLGIAFSNKLQYMQQLADDGRTPVDPHDTRFPLEIKGNAVITRGKNAQAFTLPGIAWEPLLNLTGGPLMYDPKPGFNYFPNDGVPTILGNLSEEPVELAPIPMAKHLVDTFQSKRDGKTYALFNLPFGMVAFAILNQNNTKQSVKPSIDKVLPEFENAIVGGIQLELVAGSSFENDNGQGLFEGFTCQLINLYDQTGDLGSTLGTTTHKIFNNEFLEGGMPKLLNRPGVPVTAMGISGYGTSMASKWANDEAIFAQVSKAEFNVYTGRTSHELVEVVSKEYPFGAKLVRTITIFRMSNGYVARVDSGWKAQSPGVYDFSYLDDATRVRQPNEFNFHPGIIKGVFNIRNIKEVDKPPFKTGINELQAITYDADILIDHIVEGGKEQTINGQVRTFVPAAGILGYVQIAPAGLPIKDDIFVQLLKSEGGSIGGAINCVIKIAGTDQHMKLSRFDVSPSVDSGGLPIFVGLPRGSAFLPKDGSWSLVQHSIGNGNVKPLPSQFSVPLIKEGLRPGFDAAGKDLYDPAVDIAPAALHRLADPANLIVTDPTANNYGFLQNLGSQKVLFLTPSFKAGTARLLSKTPPLLADSFRLLNSNAIFPNIGDATTNFGQAVSLLKAAVDGAGSADAFIKTGLQDLGKDVYEILEINGKKEGAKFLEQGYELAKKGVGGIIDKALKFDLPNADYNLVNLPNKLVIAIRYKTSSKPKDAPKTDYPGKFDFDVNSLAADVADNWKGKLNNMAVVVSVGPMKELMTVKGNFNAQKGKDLDLGGNDAGGGFTLPTPEIEFSKEVEPVIRILEILASLSTGDYAAALKKGLKVAMSNAGDVWEYKMEAAKDIPLVRFPPGPLYDSPQVPLKLECSLQIGFNVNAALKVTSDPTQLLPTAGAFFAFRGRLMVMCVSVGVGTVFAIGEAGIRLEADTSPKVGVILHFGFGAQISVGLPVVGTASVTFMVGVEVETTSNGKIAITAFMMFRGEAELLGGLVCICIMIEARGTVIKDGPGQPANCEVQVTFAIDVSIFLVINIHFSESWGESRQIA